MIAIRTLSSPISIYINSHFCCLLSSITTRHLKTYLSNLILIVFLSISIHLASIRLKHKFKSKIQNLMKMLATKKSEAHRVGQRSWKLLRMALLWARKGGVFKHRLMMELRVVPKFLKNHLGTSASSTKSRPQIHYFERELSFDKTPLFNLKMHRPPSMRFNIPCLNPPLVLHDDNDHLFHYDHYGDEGRKSFLSNTDHADDIDIDDDGDDLDLGTTLSDDNSAAAYSCANYEDEAVDRKADEFIAKFYQQMKLQRQISNLQYNDMLNRGTN